MAYALHPRVAVEFVSRGPQLSIKLKNLLKDGSRSRRHVIWHHKFTLHDLLVEVLVILASEWETSAEEGKEQDATGPYVSRGPAELFLANDLRGHIGWCSTEYLDLLVVRNAGTESEVNDLDVALGIKHDVFELYVSMAHALAVAVLKGANDLAIYPSSVVFVHATVRLRLEEPVSGAASHILHHQDDLIFSLNCLVELRNMRVVQSLHEFDLTSHRLLALNLLHLLFEVDLEGDLLVRLLVHADVDSGVSALAYLLAHDIVVKRGLSREDDDLLWRCGLGFGHCHIFRSVIEGSSRDTSSSGARRGFLRASTAAIVLASLCVARLPPLHDGSLDVPVAYVGVGYRLIVVDSSNVLRWLLWCAS